MKMLEPFLEMMVAERGASARTIGAYRADLEDWEAFLSARRVSAPAAKRAQLQAYVQQLALNGLSPKTQARRLSALREFYRFCYSENIIAKNPADYLLSPKLSKALPKYLGEEEVAALLETAQRKNERLYVMLELLYASGMRVSELVGLPLSAALTADKMLRVVGKGNKERLVPLNDPAARALEEWFALREAALKPGRVSKWLFPSAAKDGHLTRDAFFKALKKIAPAAGIDPRRVSPHVFRHSFASHLIAHDADLRSVQKLLGHADIATTEIYTHVLEDRLKKTVEKAHPLAYTRPKGTA